MQFIENTANKSSYGHRRLIHGAGVNDSNYIVVGDTKSNKTRCPYYARWCDMIKRCYSIPFQKTRPTYIGCTVSNEWLLFSNFKRWMEQQDWQGKQLDKDLLVQGNKVYSDITCLFVTLRINSLTNCTKSTKGKYRVGVSFDKRRKKYRASCSDGFKRVELGVFSTEKEAHERYKEFKYKLIASIAKDQKEPLKSALLNYQIR